MVELSKSGSAEGKLSFIRLLFSYLIAYIAAIIATFSMFGTDIDRETAGLSVNLVTIILFVGLSILTHRKIAIPRFKAEWRKQYSVGNRWLWIALAVPLGLCFRLGNDASMIILGTASAAELDELVSSGYAKVSSFSVLMLTGMAMGAFAEEFIERFTILPVLLERFGFVIAITISSLLFSLSHFTFELLLAGAALGALYIISRSLIACIIAHFVSNLFYPVAKLAAIELEWNSYQIACHIGLLITITVIFASFMRFKRDKNSYAASPIETTDKNLKSA